MIKVKVKPNSPEFKIEKKESRIIIHCKSPPENNQANREIIQRLEELTGKKIKIARGLTSKKKSIIIHNIDEKEFMVLLSQ